jgi:hypothetical protein
MGKSRVMHPTKLAENLLRNAATLEKKSFPDCRDEAVLLPFGPEGK